jgi:hypothetical protein
MAANYVTEDDLNEGLFCLSAMSTKEIRKDDQFPPGTAERLADAVDKALAEGRCVMLLTYEATSERPYNAYRLLNRLLVANGCAPISEEPSDERLHYRQRTVAARVRGLEVITTEWGWASGSDETERLRQGDSAGDTLE